jgi:carbonic anhydrase
MTKFLPERLALLLLPLLGLSPSSTSACFTKRDITQEDWTYDTAIHWADNPKYGQCRNGTHQSPISLSTHSLSTSTTSHHHHRPTFNYEGVWNGTLVNNGHSLQFDLAHPEGNFTTLPRLCFDDHDCVYFKTWHTHSPAEHVIDGVQSEAEMHFVHVDAQGAVRAVVGFPLGFSPDARDNDDNNNNDNNNNKDAQSKFFAQFQRAGGLPTSHDEPVQVTGFQPQLALAEVGMMERWWTYKGSLTTPPCTEGVRWFVAGEAMVLGDAQLQEVLSVSRYSCRPVQHVWRHEVGM